MHNLILTAAAYFLLLILNPCSLAAQPIHLRVNQVGYLPEDTKIAVAFSNKTIAASFSVVAEGTGEVVLSAPLVEATAGTWGKFAANYRLDFSAVTQPGRYHLRIDATGDTSRSFEIGPMAYGDSVEELLRFLRQQRCGYNPVLDLECHQQDGRAAYGPLPAGTAIDARGGWHDAGDQLKYLLTGSNATARLLLAYELEPTKFDDRVDALGRPEPNGVADVLDEARWGLDWLFKLHPASSVLYHQVADDRDHTGWKMPNEDPSDYGWGPNGARVVYAADGRPQGLKQYQSESTGLANLAGRCAAAFALAHRIWQRDLKDETFAEKCLTAARECYALGKAQEGVQQGNSYGAPYRYAETTWADDMEWAAAELYAETQEKVFLHDAARYARRASDESWMPHKTAGHYQYYPFVNVGHYALWPHADDKLRDQLAGYYRAGIEATLERGRQNAFGVGVPFIWCSNNLTAALVTQILLYERMTGDRQYHGHLLAHRDWLLGTNLWGTSMFTGIPHGGEYPDDVHTSTWKLAGRNTAGGLVDGPVYAKVTNGLIGLHLDGPDEFAEFQTSHVVYHDDSGDYSTNEPTMDGTAEAVTLLAHWGATPSEVKAHTAAQLPKPPAVLALDEGAIRRGDPTVKQLALIFTADKQVDGAETILQTLAGQKTPAAFFMTGNALDQPGMLAWVRRAIAAGHYVGPHSDGHLLYAPWEDRNKTLVEKPRFQADLYRNLAELRELGAATTEPVLFLPPYEWHNATHTAWAKELGCQLINFTPGSGSHRDFAPEDHRAFLPSHQLIEEILSYEAHADNGLNGHLLLLHLGTTRKDKVTERLNDLVTQLRERQYDFVRVDKLLAPLPTK